MENAFVFYAYWNGAQVRDLFEGLVSVTAGGGFAELAVFLVVTGLVAALLIGAVKGEGWHVISYVACAVLFWFVAVVPKATVAIEDVRSKTVYTVDNVPLSMAFCLGLQPHRALAHADLRDGVCAGGRCQVLKLRGGVPRAGSGGAAESRARDRGRPRDPDERA